MPRLKAPKPPSGYTVVTSPVFGTTPPSRTHGEVACPSGLVPLGGGAQFLLLIQEPDPLAPDASAPPAGAPIPATDEVHQRLADGTLLHVSTWMRAGSAAPAAAPPGVLAMPAEVGWTQILAGAGRP